MKEDSGEDSRAFGAGPATSTHEVSWTDEGNPFKNAVFSVSLTISVLGPLLRCLQDGSFPSEPASAVGGFSPPVAARPAPPLGGWWPRGGGQRGVTGTVTTHARSGLTD